MCQRTKGCAWFKFDKMRACHLKNDVTKFISKPSTDGIISGPAICGGKSFNYKEVLRRYNFLIKMTQKVISPLFFSDSNEDDESSTDNFDERDGNESNTNMYIVIAFIIVTIIVVVLIPFCIGSSSVFHHILRPCNVSNH